MTDIQITRLVDLPSKPPSNIESAASLAESAALILRKIADGRYSRDRLGSASWRLADALALVASDGIDLDLQGIDSPTGRGAQMTITQRGTP